MDLDQLKKELYKKDGELKDRPQEIIAPNLGAPESAPNTVWTPEKPRKSFALTVKQKKIAVISAIALSIIAAGAIFSYFWFAHYSFDKKGVYLEIFGPQNAASGEETNYIVRYKNNTKTVLQNAQLTFVYPEQSIASDAADLQTFGSLQASVITLGAVAGGQEGQQEFKARVWGDKNSQPKFSASLNYRPANVNSDFKNEASFENTIANLPLFLSFDLPKKAVSGQDLNFTLQYINTSDNPLADLKIKLVFPNGFTFKSSLPASAEGAAGGPDAVPTSDNQTDNIWPIGEISGHEEGKILINGALAGLQGENKLFTAQIGIEKNGNFIIYSQAAGSSEISSSPLSIEQTVNAPDLRVDPGQILNYKIKYKNTTETVIGPVTINLKIDSRAVDFNSINVSAGYFSGIDNSITLNSASLPELASLNPGQEGETGFSLTIKSKEQIPVKTFSDKNFTVKTSATINSDSVPLALKGTSLKGESQMTIKLNSRPDFKSKIIYYDNLLQNSGPLPPRANQKTTYTIYWQILNLSNDLSGVTVEASLPSYIHWENNVSPTNENIKYDPATGKIIWNINKLSSGTGVLLPVKQAAFQVGMTPSGNQIGLTPDIMQGTVISAKDEFTGLKISQPGLVLTSELPDDPKATYGQGRVME